MSSARPDRPRLQALFLAALVGLLAVVGTVVGDLLGAAAAVAYTVVVLGVLAAGAARARGARAAAGRTCTCCATSQHDPVRVV